MAKASRRSGSGSSTGRAERSVLLIDANLLTLLVVGATSTALIAKHKKTRAFVAGDYDLLVAHADQMAVLIIPNVATETSNLIGFHADPERKRLFATLRVLLASFCERCVPSVAAAMQPEFERIGLTDAAILIASDEAEILTTDNGLCIAAQKRGLRAVNFNHLRDGVTV